MDMPTPAQYQGSLKDRYEIYVALCSDGDYIKTFDEWLNS